MKKTLFFLLFGFLAGILSLCPLSIDSAMLVSSLINPFYFIAVAYGIFHPGSHLGAVYSVGANTIFFGVIGLLCHLSQSKKFFRIFLYFLCLAYIAFEFYVLCYT